MLRISQSGSGSLRRRGGGGQYLESALMAAVPAVLPSCLDKLWLTWHVEIRMEVMLVVCSLLFKRCYRAVCTKQAPN